VNNNFFFNQNLDNIYLRPSIKSEVSSQILYGEKFSILNKKKKWLKIKTSYDNYIGYIKNNNFIKNFKATHKIFKLKSQIYKKLNNKFIPIKKFMYFGTKIMVINQHKNFVNLEKNIWIKKKDIRKFNHIEKNSTKIFKLFVNTKYLWGGKSCEGIDCSALVQIYFYYNNFFFPRDSKDQVKYCKRISNNNYKEGNIIYWKGHVGVCLKNQKFIHAYGPRKKVVIMNTRRTIKLIKKTAHLNVKKISNIKNY